MNSEINKLVVSLLYGIPSFLLYILIFVQLVRPKHKKRFDNPFYRLCFLIGVVDCLGYIHYFVFFVLPMYSFISPLYASSLFASSPFTTAIYFSNYVFGYLQLFGNCFLTFNRFTSIVFPLTHAKIWIRCYPLSVVITVVSALAPCWYVSTTAAWYTPLFDDAPEKGYGLKSDDYKYPFFSNSFNKFLSNLLACSLCLLMNVTSSACLFFRTSQYSNRKVELNLFFVTLMIFIAQSITSVQQILIYVAMKANDMRRVAVLYSLTPWLNDLKFLSPPWILIMVSSASPLRNPSFLLYIVILFQLIRPKCQNRFGNPFYRLCFLIGIVDCVGYLDFYIFITLPTYSLFVSFYRSSLFSPSAFTTAVYFSNYVFGYLQLFGNCFLTFNRFTCVVFPTNHAKIWRYCFPFSIERLLQVLIYIALETNNDMMITMLFTLLPWLSDFKYLSPPWVLIFISTSIRQTVVQLLPKRLVHYAKHSLLATSTATITTVNVKPLNGG
ncbi:hypothetical protein QR680_008507 [Steinernema hermaphroditum]|uniref:Serpentine receptor class gamma n=1 Tax=Steinernema hermaphroditum TaxID=289476 RepID=A0AA39IID5_9BILA|nr:hypothetical protein QR680_008507 [Steinernema hermaphroditum]